MRTGLSGTNGFPVSHDECNGWCLTPADLGLPEYGYAGIAYAHPDCPDHGEPLDSEPSEHVCGGGDESLRYVREEDIAY